MIYIYIIYNYYLKYMSDKDNRINIGVIGRFESGKTSMSKVFVGEKFSED